ncbi:MAG TPA: hypothetical protein VEX38_10685, partial [Fimbriimonadaceae bacterium]|nr:hypothetical protein [Fimbriimonadaceae bacterium]
NLPGRQEASGPQGKTRWAIDSDSMRGTPTSEIYTNGSASDGEIMVKAPRIEREKKTDVITATGKVYYFSEKANIVCDKAVIYQKEKRAVLTGNVRMLVKPKDQEKLDFTEVAPFEPLVPNKVLNDRPAPPPSAQAQQEKDLDDELRSSKTVRKYPVKVQAARVEYWYAKGQRKATITGNPQARQELAGGRWRHIWTHQAFYDGEKETLRLVSDKDKRDTRMKNSIEDDLVAQAVTISTREEDEDYEVEKPKGFVHTDPQDDPRDKKGGGTPPPANTGGGSGGTGGGSPQAGTGRS